MQYHKLPIVVALILLVLSASSVAAFDCRRYIFAPKCRGISAKRSSDFNTYRQELFGNEEDNLQRSPEMESELYDDVDLSPESKTDFNKIDLETSEDLRFIHRLSNLIKDPIMRRLIKEKLWKNENKM